MDACAWLYWAVALASDHEKSRFVRRAQRSAAIRPLPYRAPCEGPFSCSEQERSEFEAARPVDSAQRSLKTEQRVIGGLRPFALLEPDPAHMHRAGPNNSVMFGHRYVYAVVVSYMTTLL